MAQFVNKLRDCMRTVNLTMLLVLNLFFIVTLNLTVATVLVVLKADHGFFIQDGFFKLRQVFFHRLRLYAVKSGVMLCAKRNHARRS